MDTEPKKELSGNKTALIVCAAVVIAFMVYFGIMSVIAPGKELSVLKARYGIKSSEENKLNEDLFTDSAYVSLLKDKVFLQSKVAMAETDSISLALNLADSSVSLEISGVNVHMAKIRKLKISKILYSGEPGLITSMLATPLNIVMDYATIRKEPLMIKMAPKDTSEYKPDIIPDTSDYEPVNYILETDSGLRVYIFQDEENTPLERKNRFFFDLNYRLRNLKSSLKSVVSFKVPEYHPYIKIWLPKTDAKIVYRAMPRYGQIAVYL